MGLAAFNRMRRQRAAQQRPEPPQQERHEVPAEPVHIGGGWYRIPGHDDPVQGREAAEQAIRTRQG